MLLTNSQTCRILIVDDSEDDRAVIRRLLNRSPYDCTFDEAVSLEDAQALLSNNTYDCALIDYQLPGFSGLDVVTKLLDGDAHQFMGAIMVTGQGSESLAVDALKAGVDDYLVKSDLNESSIYRAVRNSLTAAQTRKQAAEHRKALENFSGLVAHDLLSPLSTVLGFLDLTLLEHRDKMPHSAVENLEYASTSGRYMADMIKGLLAYAKSGQIESDMETVDLTALAHEGLTMCSAVVRDASASVEISALPKATVNVNEFIQLFQNLIANAIKHSDRSSPHIEIFDASHGETVLIAVKDDGPGIKTSALDKIFDPLERASSTTEGLGLGLALCKKIVAAAGGRIWCESEVRHGAIFYIELPTP